MTARMFLAAVLRGVRRVVWPAFPPALDMSPDAQVARLTTNLERQASTDRTEAWLRRALEVQERSFRDWEQQMKEES